MIFTGSSIAAGIPRAKLARSAAILFAALFAAYPLMAQSQSAHHTHDQPSASTESTREMSAVGRPSIPDVVLTNQDGRRVRFYNDLVKGKVVIINFIFTSCTTICPPMGANFATLQKMMADRKHEGLSFISISVDPVTDTPAKLKTWSEQFHHGSGWTLLTGEKNDVDAVLKGLKVYAPRKDDHSPIVLIGSEPEGKWVRAYGLAPPSKLAEMLDVIIGESNTAQSRSPGQQ